MLRPRLLGINKLQQQPAITALHFSKFLILSLYESWKLLKEFKHLKLADMIPKQNCLSHPSHTDAVQVTQQCCTFWVLIYLWREFQADASAPIAAGRCFLSVARLQGASRFCAQGGKFSPLFFKAVVTAMSFSKCLAGYQCELLYILVRKPSTLANACAVSDFCPWFLFLCAYAREGGRWVYSDTIITIASNT